MEIISDDIFIATIQQHLGVNINPEDLDRTHRLGARKPAGPDGPRPRPIIAKFARYNKRKEVFVEKKKFKGTKIMLTESLTRRRVDMLNAARKRYRKKEVWTKDGEIFTKIAGEIVNIKTL